MPPPASMAASFFIEVKPREHRCRVCSKTIRTSQYTKSNLNRHMKTCHPVELARHLDAARAPARSHSMLEYASAKPAREVRMQNNSAEYKAISKALVRFVASSYLPLSVVENKEFCQFVSTLNATYPVPGRRWLRSQIMEMAATKKTALKRTLMSLPRDSTVAITIDLWTSRRLLSYLGMTVHFIDCNGSSRLEAYLLAFRRFAERHTADNILAAYQEVVEEFDLQGKIMLLVTDSASNMLKAFRVSFTLQDCGEGCNVDEDEEEGIADDYELEVTPLVDVMDPMEELAGALPQRVSCGAHSLQLVVKDGIKTTGHGPISKSLTRLNAFVGAVKKSTLAMETLAKNSANLLAANVTRWSSQLRAVTSFVDLPALVLQELRLIPQLHGKCPDSNDRVILKEVATILAPFAVATDVLQGEKVVTASHLVPTIMGLRATLMDAPPPATPAVKQLRAGLLASLNRRFREVEVDPIFRTATLLDPRFKLLPWDMDDDKAQEVRRACLRHLKAQFRSRPFVSREDKQSTVQAEVAEELASAPEVVVVSDDDDPTAGSSGASSGSWSCTTTPIPVATAEDDTATPTEQRWSSKRTCLYGFMKKPAAVSPTDSRRASLDDELARYLQEPTQPDDIDPVAFWAVQRVEYPQLEVAARNHLGVTASSGPSERIFSISGKMFSPTRSRIHGDLIEALMHIKC